MKSHEGGKETPRVSIHDLEKGANSADGVSPKHDESKEVAEKKAIEEKKKTTTKPLWKAATAIILVAAILSIPLILSFTRFKTASIARVPLAGLFIWLEVCWGLLWVLYYGFLLLPWLVAIVSPEDLNKLNYPKLIRRLKLPLTLLFWTITSWATTTPIICYSNRHLCVASWVNTLRKVLSATMVVAAIFLVEQFLMKLILVDNIRNFLGPKKYIICRYFNILGKLLGEGSSKKCQRLRPKPREDEKIKTLLSPTPKVRCVWGVDESSTLDQDEEGRVSKLTTRIWKMLIKSKGSGEHSGSEKEAYFEPKELESIIEKFISHETYAHVIKDDSQRLKDIMQALDPGQTKKITRGSIEDLVKRLLISYKKCREGVKNIENIIQFLDRTLLVVVLIVGGLVYGIFLNQGFASHLMTAWLAFTGLAFAIAGTVTEFFAACFFVFVKHPYHSGDEVVIDKKFFTVGGIYLMHSTFINEGGDAVQIPHSELQTKWVTNFSRSDNGREELLGIRPAADKCYKKETEKKAEEAKWRELLTIYGQLRSNEGTNQSIKDAKRILENQIEDCSPQINKLEEEKPSH